MYKFIGLAMMGIFVMMIIPGNIDTTQNELVMYGMGNIVKYDASGNEVFQQSVHNQLTDQGEQVILGAIFADGNDAEADVTSFGAICVSSASEPASESLLEAHTAALFDTANTIINDGANLTCQMNGSAAIVITGGQAIVGPFTFTEDADATPNVDVGDTISSIAICQQDSDVSQVAEIGFVDCELGTAAAGGLMLATLAVTPTTLATGETVDITYTFDIRSPLD